MRSTIIVLIDSFVLPMSAEKASTRWKQIVDEIGEQAYKYHSSFLEQGFAKSPSSVRKSPSQKSYLATQLFFFHEKGLRFNSNVRGEGGGPLFLQLHLSDRSTVPPTRKPLRAFPMLQTWVQRTLFSFYGHTRMQINPHPRSTSSTAWKFEEG